jgi:hypothetical protein
VFGSESVPAMTREFDLRKGSADRKVAIREKRSNSAGDFRAFDSLSQPEAAIRQNVWQSGALNRVPKYG